MKRWVYTLLICLFGAVFLISFLLLGNYFLQSHRAQSQAKQLQTIRQSQSSQRPDFTENATSPFITVTDPHSGAEISILKEFVELYTVNNHLVGWLTIPGTNIDYPVLQTPNSVDYYLHRDFYKKYSSHGSIYARESCDITAPSDNITLYGHRMKDGTMFAALANYKDFTFWQQYPEIHFDTLKKYQNYEIFAVFLTDATAQQGFSYHTFENAANAADFDAFVAGCKSLSLYDTGITPQYGDKLLTLSTCDYFTGNGRLVVVACAK